MHSTLKLAPALLTLATLHVAAPAAGQLPEEHQPSNAELAAEIQALKAGQASLSRRLNEALTLLEEIASSHDGSAEAAETSLEVAFSVKGEPSLGEAGAPVTIVEFSDYQ